LVRTHQPSGRRRGGCLDGIQGHGVCEGHRACLASGWMMLYN